MWYRGFLALLLMVAVASVSCSEDDVVQVAAGDPNPSGMGVMAATAAAGGINAVTLVLNDAAIAAPVLKAAPNLVVGAFPEQNSIQCDTGSMTISGDTDNPPITATFTNCQDGPYTVNGGAAITIPSVQTCTEDGDSHDVPTAMTATVNNGTTVSVDGQVLTLTNFGVAVTNPIYNGAPQRAEEGGTCGIVGAQVVATGVMSTAFQGQTTTINFGSSSLNTTFSANEFTVLATMAGNISVDTICTDGAFPLTISTLSELEFPTDDGDGTPTGGILVVNGENVDFSDPNVRAIPCTGFL